MPSGLSLRTFGLFQPARPLCHPACEVLDVGGARSIRLVTEPVVRQLGNYRFDRALPELAGQLCVHCCEGRRAGQEDVLLYECELVGRALRPVAVPVMEIQRSAMIDEPET